MEPNSPLGARFNAFLERMSSVVSEEDSTPVKIRDDGSL